MVVVRRPGVRFAVMTWLVGGALLAGSGCGGKSHPANGSGSGAVSGAGGSGGAGGSAGVGGASGSDSGTGGVGPGGAGSGGAGGASAGSGGSSAGVSGAAAGGSGGVAGTAAGGTSGVAGTTGGAGAGSGGGGGDGDAGFANQGSYPECETSEDCQLTSDCCGCQAVATRGTEFCALDCVRDPCPEMGITAEEVRCTQGRCVLARSCDATGVTCRAAPPVCPEGTVPSVVDDCWGPCLPPTECWTVGSCDDCGDAFCVEFQGMRTTFNCVTRVGACAADNYCECLGVCGECTATDNAVACPCGGC